MQEMTPDERRAFLMAGTRTGKLGVTRRDGQPTCCRSGLSWTGTMSCS
jgi:hypothetical protein